MRQWIVLSLGLVASSAALGDEVGRSFRKVVPAAGVEHVEVEISVGALTIRSGTGKQIEVRGVITRELRDDSERNRRRAEEIVRDLNVEVEIRGDRAIIRESRGAAARFSRGNWVHSEMDVKVTLPAGVNLRVEQSVGELDISGDFRDVNVEMRVGELTVRLPKANVKELTAGARVGEVHADFGERSITREGLFAGNARFANPRGSSTVDLKLTIGEIDVRLE